MGKMHSSSLQLQAKAILEIHRRKHGHKPPFEQYSSDPVGFAVRVLGIKYLTDEQKSVMISIRDNRETNVPAGHGVGKTFLAAIIVLWWVFAVGGRAITTAPTENQVKELLWSEIRELYRINQKKLGGECMIMSMRLTEKARAYGFTARDYSPDSFQGVHGEKLLAIQDEANGITEEIDDGFESCITGADNRGLRIGNPVTAGTPFEKSCKLTAIRIPVFSHPNVAWAYDKCEDGIYRLKPAIEKKIITHENGRREVLPQSRWPEDAPKDKIPGAVSISWIESTREKKGEKSAFWTSRLMAQFPTDSHYSIVPRSWFQAARARYDANPQKWDDMASGFDWRHGLDVGDGGDPHALSSWKGAVLYAVDEKATLGDQKDVSRAATWGVNTLKKRDGLINVDNIGVGSGTLSQIKQTEGFEQKAGGTKFSAKTKFQGKNLNKKTDLYWALREAFQENEIAVAPLGKYEDELMDELSNIHYEEMSTEKIRIEDKKKSIKRIGHSPNLADATVLGFTKPTIINKKKRRAVSVTHNTY